MTADRDSSSRLRKRLKVIAKTKDTGPEEADLFQPLYSFILQVKDENGRTVLKPFEKLPSKRLYPDYYQIISHPMALEMIRSKIENSEYKSLEELRKDFQLIISNAKLYNEPESVICKAANVLAKGLRDFENDSRYLSFIMTKLLRQLRKLEEDNTKLTIPFEELPRKVDYPDYFKIIKEPICLLMIEEKMREKRYTDIKDFAHDVCLMFDNALRYNEPNTIIWNDAEFLKSEFLKNYDKESFKNIESGPKLRLKVGGASSNKSPTSNKIRLSLNNAQVKPVKLEYDQKSKTTSDGSRSLKLNIDRSRVSVDMSRLRARKTDADSSAEEASLKHLEDEPFEKSKTQGSFISTGSSRSSRLLIPKPSLTTPEYSNNVPVNNSIAPNFYSSVISQVENVWERQKYFPSLITKVCIETIDLNNDFKMELATSSEFTSQIFSIILSPKRSNILVTPTMSPLLMMRPHQITVSVNGKKMNPRMPPNPSLYKPHGIDLLRRKYEAKLVVGVNCVEILVSAAKPELTKNGRPLGPISVNDMERERMVMFFYLKA